MSTRTIIRCQLVPKLIPADNECRLYIRACLERIMLPIFFSYWVTKYHKQNTCNQKHLRIICVYCTDMFINWYELLIFYYPFKPSRCMKASFYIPKNRPNFPKTKGFLMKMSMKLVWQCMVIFFNFSLTSNHLYPLQVDNCDSKSRLLVDEDDNGKFRLKRVKQRFCDNILLTNYCIMFKVNTFWRDYKVQSNISSKSTHFDGMTK